MVVMAARPDVKMDAWPIAVIVVVPGAMQVPAVPVASVPDLHRAFRVHRSEFSGYAAHRRGLSRYCHEAEGQRGGDGCEQATAYHEFELPCVCGRGASAKKRNVVFALPSVVDWPTPSWRKSSALGQGNAGYASGFRLAVAMDGLLAQRRCIVELSPDLIFFRAQVARACLRRRSCFAWRQLGHRAPAGGVGIPRDYDVAARGPVCTCPQASRIACIRGWDVAVSPWNALSAIAFFLDKEVSK